MDKAVSTLEKETIPKRPWAGWPIKTILWTVVVACIIAFVHFNAADLIQNRGMDPAIRWIITFGLSWMTILIWSIWLFFYTPLKRIGILVFLAPIIFITLYYPDFGGDLSLLSWKPRFWKYRTAVFEAPAENIEKVQVVTTTPYDFQQFLGPTRDLHVDSVSLSDWSEPPEQLWKIDVGNGWSGFVVVGGRAVTQEQRDDQECVTCYDVLTGKLIWIHQEAKRHEDAMAMGKEGPRATPTIHDNLVYTVGATGVLNCLSLSDGTLVWSKDISRLVNVNHNEATNSLGLTYTTEDSALAWGRSGSPLVYKDFVVVPAGGPLNADGKTSDASTLIAFDRKSGDEVWRGGNRQIAYGSPGLITVQGQDMITLVAEDRAVGHDPETGKELWAIERVGKSNQDANCSQVTQLGNDTILLTKGYGLGGEICQIEKTENGWEAKSVSKDRSVLKTKMTNPVVIDGNAYAITDGYLQCVQITDSGFKKKWRQRGRFGDGQLIAVGDRILIHSEFGKLTMFQASPEKYLSKGTVDQTIEGFCWNTLCVYGDLLIVRSNIEAACYRLPVEGEAIAATQIAKND